MAEWVSGRKNKPSVFKMGSFWVWRCPHHTDEPRWHHVPGDAYTDAWSVAYANALDHYVHHHCESDDVETI